MGMTVHHTVGSLDSAEQRFNDPSSGASAHFGIGFDGSVRQWVDTDLASYHACRANWTGWIGVEHESSGDPDHWWEPMTPEQVQASGLLLRWLHETYGVPLQVSDDVNVGGLTYHSLDPGSCSSHWGITGCPGAAMAADRYAIVDVALGNSPAPVPEPEPQPEPSRKKNTVLFVTGNIIEAGQDGEGNVLTVLYNTTSGVECARLVEPTGSLGFGPTASSWIVQGAVAWFTSPLGAYGVGVRMKALRDAVGVA